MSNIPRPEYDGDSPTDWAPMPNYGPSLAHIRGSLDAYRAARARMESDGISPPTAFRVMYQWLREQIEQIEQIEQAISCADDYPNEYSDDLVDDTPDDTPDHDEYEPGGSRFS